MTGLLLLLTASGPAQADREPANCTGSGLGIGLYLTTAEVRLGSLVFYSVEVFNGLTNTGRIVCDASEITAFVVTPDGVTNSVVLARTLLHNGESDYYINAVSYVARARDFQPDGTLRATAAVIGAIHQNDRDSVGGGF